MNIRVDLNTPINDGTEVVFRSPVDCSQVTGLIVYYDGGSQEFMFADAHGYNVGNIDHLFAENVVVKVILDVTTSMAFVQNADTNAYLEWRFKDTIDKLAPSFTESGSVVSCNPVEGYPLSIVSHIEPVQAGSGDPSPENVRAISGFEQVKVWQGGKNLVDPALYIQSSANTTLEGDVFTTNFTSGGLYVNRYGSAKGIHPAGTYTVSVIPVSSYVYLSMFVYDHATGKEIKRLLNVGEQNGYALTFTADAPFRVSIAGSNENANLGTYSYKLQLEVGTTATEYEPYRGNEITLDLGQTVYGGSLDWKTGLLTITKKMWIMTGTESGWSESSEASEKACSIFVNSSATTDKKLGYGTSVCSHFLNTKDNSAFNASKVRIGIYGDHSDLPRMYFDWGENSSTTPDFKAWLAEQYANGTPVTVVYDLATPTTIQLTPQEILALAGTNSIYSNTGNTDVSGKSDPNAVIQDLYNKLNALSATMTALTGV